MTPSQIDEMPANDVYMILFARKARAVNQRFEELAKKQHGSKDHSKLDKMGDFV